MISFDWLLVNVLAALFYTSSKRICCPIALSSLVLMKHQASIFSDVSQHQDPSELYPYA